MSNFVGCISAVTVLTAMDSLLPSTASALVQGQSYSVPMAGSHFDILVCQNRNRMVKKFVVPLQKLLQPEGTLASSSVFKLMGPKSASLVLSCCLSAVSTCSCATRLAALALVASRSPVKTVKIWLIWLACPTPCRRPGTSALACRAAQGCI